MSEGRSDTGAPLRALVVTTFLVYFGWGMTSPVLPLFGRSVGASEAATGLLVAAFAVASFSFDIIGGRVSDRIGARRAAVGGAGLITISSVLAGFAPGFGALLLARLLTGVGSAFYVTTAMNIIARTTLPERMGRSMSTYQGAILTGVALGPAAGGLITEVAGLRLPFFAYAACATACTVMAARTLPVRLPPPAAATVGGMGLLLRDPAFLTGLAVAFVVFVVRAGVTSTAVPLFANEGLRLSRGWVGGALTLSAVSNLLWLPHAGRLADRYPRKLAATVGLVAGLVGLSLLAVSSIPALFAAMLVLGVATAYAGVTPAAIVTDVAPPAQSGTALGLYRMAVDGASIVAPISAGVIAGSVGYRGVFLAFLLPLVLALVAVLRLRDTRQG